MRQRKSWFWPFKTILVFLAHTAAWLRAMPIWGGSTKQARSSPGCAPLRLWSCRAICCIYATPRIASFCCRACAWRRAKKHEADRLSAVLCRHHDPGMAAFLEPAGTLLLGLGASAGLARDLRDRLPLRARGVDHPALPALHPGCGLHRPRADRDDPVIQRHADLVVDGLRPGDGEHANPDGEPAAALVFIDGEIARRGRPLGGAGLCLSGDCLALGHRPAVVRLHHGAAGADPGGADDGGARAAAVLGDPAAGEFRQRDELRYLSDVLRLLRTLPAVARQGGKPLGLRCR